MKSPTVEQVISKLQKKYLRYVEVAYGPHPSWLNVEKDGTHPNTFYLFQFEPAPFKFQADCHFARRAQLAVWLLERDKITALDPATRLNDVRRKHYPDPAAEEADHEKMFWTYGLAMFAYNQRNGVLEEAFTVGPLNGQGFVSRLRLDSQGEIEIIKPRLAWIS